MAQKPGLRLPSLARRKYRRPGHAAVNSRGDFFSASDPEEFADKLSSSLEQIIGRTGSAAAIATNSTRLNADTYVYQARFDSKDWRGELLGYKIDQNTGAIIDAKPNTAELDPDWEAAKLLDNKKRTGAQQTQHIHP